MIGLHYEAVMDTLGYCPIPVVCGVNRLGKTKSARAALSLIGNKASFFSSVKERFIPRLCARTTLPPVLDDLKKGKQIEDIAVAFYNRGKDGTCFLESTPRTCPILTVNWEVLDALNQDPRYVHYNKAIYVVPSKVIQDRCPQRYFPIITAHDEWANLTLTEI